MLTASGAVRGAPLVLLRLEGAVVLLAAGSTYAALGGGAWAFALLFFAPDLSMAGYLAGRARGAMIYNLAHAYAAPAVVAAILIASKAPKEAILCLIWAAHIGFDRLLGYGLKYPEGFGVTHLGLVGAWARAAQTGRAAATSHGVL